MSDDKTKPMPDPMDSQTLEAMFREKHKLDIMSATISDKKIPSGTTRGANLISTIFDVKCMQGADFRDSYMRDVSFIESDLRGANFQRAQIWTTNFTNCDLTGANLAGARILMSDLRSTKFTHEILACASVAGCVVTAEQVIWLMGRHDWNDVAETIIIQQPHGQFVRRQ